MLLQRLGLVLAAGAVAVTGLVASPVSASASARPGTFATHATTSRALAADGRRHQQKKLRLTISSITPYGGPAWRYVWTVTTRSGVPVPGVKFKVQYHQVKGRWTDEGRSFVSDANGQFELLGCNISMGVERMYSKPTRRHRAIAYKYQWQHCA